MADLAHSQGKKQQNDKRLSMLCIEYIQMSRKRIWWIVWACISLEHSHFYFTWKVLISEIMSCIFCACLSKPLMFCLDLNIFNIYQPQCYNDLCDKPPDFSIIIWITSNTSDGLTMFRKMCKFRKNISKTAEIYVFISEEKLRLFDGKTSNTQRPWKLSKSWYTGYGKLY